MHITVSIEVRNSVAGTESYVRVDRDTGLDLEGPAAGTNGAIDEAVMVAVEKAKAAVNA